MGEAALRRERQALRALLHPFAVVGLVVWLANDHLFKAQFGNALTGKLSDVAGLVVFPLLVAATLALWIRRPMPVAIVLTVAGYSAVNLSTWADQTAERMASLVTPMRLTADPTDLVLLPAVAVAAWVWRRVADDRPALRRSWANTLFAVGITATLATSQSEWESERFSGTFVLTGEQRVMDLGLEVMIDDEIVDPATLDLRNIVTFTAFGSGLEPDPLVESWDGHALYSGLAQTPSGPVMRYELQDLAAAPVEVRWQLYVVNGATGGIFNGDGGQPTLIVQAPPDDFGPEPVFFWQPPVPIPEDPEPLPRSIAELEVQLASPESRLFLAFVGSSADNEPWIRAATPDAIIEVDAGRLMTVDPPVDCEPTGPCSVNVWVSAPTDWPDFGVELYAGTGDVLDVNIVEHRATPVPIQRTFGPFASEGIWDPSMVVGVTATSANASDPIRHVTDAVTLDVETRLLSEPQNLNEGDFFADSCCFIPGRTFLFDDGVITAMARSQRLGAQGAPAEWEFEVEAQVWWVPALRGAPTEVDITLSIDGS